ncbi:MAG: HAMP domain-containing histidine kinase [Oscillospiraceae bacterium]|nr:HAMP domain-containing histidine kinase [Oscillospiraceae bacterium]
MNSITVRWIFNTLGVIVFIIIVLIIGFSVMMQNYYYTSVRQTMTLSADTNANFLSRHESGSGVNITAETRMLVENFSQKDKIEMFAIDNYGRVVVTSSGFAPDDDIEMPDYIQALSEGTGYHTGRIHGDNVMAITHLMPVSNNEISALRYLVSLREVDRIIFISVTVFGLVCVVVLLIVLTSGMYFVRSIVMPVRQIGAAARKIATGEFDVRVNMSSKDELGELCSTINDMAEELGSTQKIKNEFISSVSHELRTPLTAIKGWGETILSSGTGDKKTFNKGMGIIINETERLTSMVEELLDFSRMQGGKLLLTTSETDILSQLEETVFVYSEKAKREGKILKYHPPETLPEIMGDKNRLRQVFINVIDNALKYSDTGGVINVTAEQSEDCVLITVSDSGCGIGEESLPYIKQKFYKANLTRRGSGIGLAVADEIITMHGGTITITSKENHGTTVTIRLPAIGV